jgi:hypothetical protein
VGPRGGADPERWSDLVVTPSAAVMRRGQSFGVMWEAYGLEPRGGTERYRVELALTVLGVARPDNFIARIIGGVADAVGLSAKGDNPVALAYERERPAGPVALDYVTLELGDAPAGRYRLAVRVTDRNAGTSATATRELTITP